MNQVAVTALAGTLSWRIQRHGRKPTAVQINNNVSPAVKRVDMRKQRKRKDLRDRGSTPTFTFYTESERERRGILRMGSNESLFCICVLISRRTN